MQDRTFEWETDFYPTHGDIEKEQESRGYHPAGYGGPFSVRIDKVEKIEGDKPKWKTTWSCSGSCD